MAKKKKKATTSQKPAKKAAKKAAPKKAKKGTAKAAARKKAAKKAPAKKAKQPGKKPLAKKAARKVAPKRAVKKAAMKKAAKKSAVKKVAAKSAAPKMAIPKPSALNVAAILIPSADLQLVACPNNRVKVRVRVPAGLGFNECRAYVSATFGNACDAAPTTTVNLPSVGGDEYEGLLDLPGTPTQFQRFRICAYPSRNCGAQLGNPESRQFFASLAQTAPVPATASLWFGWTSGSAPWGTHNEIPDNHQPVKIAIPTSPVRPTQVLVSTSDNDWGHPPLSKADGYGNGELAKAQYHTLANIAELPLAEARLNRLVGLFADPGNPAGAEIGFGLAETTANVPNAGETQFWLAHHDGYEWNNNVQQVTATYYWVST